MFCASPAIAHAVALDRLGEDHRRLALVIDRRVIRRVDLVRVVAAAVQVPDVVVGPVGDQRLQLGRVEEMLADVRAVLGLERLVLAVDALPSSACTGCPSCRARAARPSACPRSTLITFQPAPRKSLSSSWMILPLPRTGPSSRCRLQLTTKIRLSSFSRDGHADRAHRLGLVHLAVAHERPDLAALGVRERRGPAGTS